MKQVIWLRDIPNVNLEPRDNILRENQLKAREILAARGLRFCNETGRIYDGRGMIERYVDERGHIPHDSENAVMFHEFSRWINNAAQRIQRGLPV